MKIIPDSCTGKFVKILSYLAFRLNTKVRFSLVHTRKSSPTCSHTIRISSTVPTAGGQGRLRLRGDFEFRL